MDISQDKYIYNNLLPKYSNLAVQGLLTKKNNISLNTILITKRIFIYEKKTC